MHLSGVERDGAARLAIFDGEHGGGGLDDHRGSAIPGELQIGVLPFGMQAYGRLRRGLGCGVGGRGWYRLLRGRLRLLQEEARSQNSATSQASDQEGPRSPLPERPPWFGGYR